MTRWMFATTLLGLGILGACSDDKEAPPPAPCEMGGLGCACYPNDTCDEGLSCVTAVGLCAYLGTGFGGTTSGGAGPDGAAGERGDSGGEPGTDGGSGGKNQGGTGNAGGSVNIGGAGSIGGTGSSGGSVNIGGSINIGGSGGSGGSPGFPDSPLACALVTSCPTCCETVGVYALDALSNDATSKFVTSFAATESAATAEYQLATSDAIGAIFFRFETPQDIGSLSLEGTGTGGSLEIALVREGGLDGCIYPIIAGTLSSIPDTCWGLGAGPYAALPADQIEIRVRSLVGGRAALSVTALEYGP